MVQEPKFCVNCVHHSEQEEEVIRDISLLAGAWKYMVVVHTCHAPQLICPVTGRQLGAICHYVRQPGKCGPEGAWYVGT